MRLAYLSSPYSDPDPTVQNRRAGDAARAVNWLVGQKYYAVSPIIHHAGLVAEGFPAGRQAAYTLNHCIIEHCDWVVVLCIRGWMRSIGVTEDMQLAKALSKPIMFLIPEPGRAYRLSSVPY